MEQSVKSTQYYRLGSVSIDSGLLEETTMRLIWSRRSLLTAAVCGLAACRGLQPAQAQAPNIDAFAQVYSIFGVTAQREAPIGVHDHHYSIQLSTGAYYK